MHNEPSETKRQWIMRTVNQRIFGSPTDMFSNERKNHLKLLSPSKVCDGLLKATDTVHTVILQYTSKYVFVMPYKLIVRQKMMS